MNKPLRLDPLFNDHMVIQRNKRFVVWGTGNDGVSVTVTCRGESASDEVREGQWSVTLPAMGVGEVCELIVQTAESTITLVDVVFGDVWLAGGQSNIEWPLNKSEDAEIAIASANLPLLRYYEVPKVAFEVEGIKFKSKWKTCTPENAGDFSAGVSIEDDQAVVHFDYATAGLVIRAGDQLAGFQVAAEDGKFHPAEAEIHGSRVRVSSEKVGLPRFVRYGWTNVTDANLMGLDGLPAAPFRASVNPRLLSQ